MRSHFETFDRHAAKIAHLSWLAGTAALKPAPGELVARFYLPLAMCMPRDRLRRETAWQAKERRDQMVDALNAQWRDAVGLFDRPLPGRPHVICTRYSSTEPDSTSGWGKLAVDCLQPGGIRNVSKRVRHPITGEMVKVTRPKAYAGLGLIRNDRPKDCEVREVWRRAKRGKGFCVIEVWSGDGR